MTTVIASLIERKMACDSRCTGGSTAPFSVKKIFETKEGYLIGFCGNVVDALHFIDWYKKGKKGAKPDPSEIDFRALVLKHDVIEYWDNCYTCIPIYDEFYGIGSGSYAALGALHTGVSVERAIEIACLVDKDGSGLPIQTLELPIKPTKGRNSKQK